MDKRTIYRVSPLIILGIVIIFYQLWGKECIKLLDTLLFLLSIILFIVYFIVLTGISIYQEIKSIRKFSFIPFYVLISCGLIFFIITFLKSERLKSERILVANSLILEAGLENSLILRQDNSYELSIQSHDKTCTEIGTYTQIQDTLILTSKRNISIKYVLDTERDLIYRVGDKDSINYFKITKYNAP